MLLKYRNGELNMSKKEIKENRTSEDPKLPEEIKNSDLYKFNEHCRVLLAEAETYLSFFETEKDCNQSRPIVYNNKIAWSSFVWIRKMMFESLSLSLARMFDESFRDKNTHKKCNTKHRKYKEKYAIRDLLEKAATEKDLLQNYTDKYKNNCGNVEAKIKEFNAKLDDSEVKNVLTKLTDLRNTYIAHNSVEKCDITESPLDIPNLKTILSFASNITNYIHCCLTGKKYKPWTDGYSLINGYIRFYTLFRIIANGITALPKEDETNINTDI